VIDGGWWEICEEQKGTAFFPGSKLAGEGLLVSDGELWRRQRQLSTPAFRKAAVERYAKVC
jgi:cytochrome P450